MRTKWGALVVAALVIAVSGVGFGRGDDSAWAQPMAGATVAATSTPTATPAVGAMTIYGVTNPNAVTLNVRHAFSDATGFSYSFWDAVQPGATSTYHVSAMPQIPTGFQGTLVLSGDQTFSSQIVGYDYAGSPAPTPTVGSPSPTTTPGSPTATPTASRTPTTASSPTGGPTLTPTPTLTATTTPGGSSILFQSSFAGGSFSSWTAWGTNGASGASATVASTADVDADGYGARFVVQGATNGQAYAQESVAWPASQVLTASGSLYVNTTTLGNFGVARVLELHKGGPLYNSITDVEVNNGAWTLALRTLGGGTMTSRLAAPPSPQQWATLQLAYDLSGPYPVASAWLNGALVASITDTTAGATYAPDSVLYEAYETSWIQALDVDWDNVAITSAAPGLGTPTPTATASSTATATPTPVWSPSPTPTSTGTATVTPSSTPTSTAVPSDTSTATPTPTFTPKATATPSSSPTATPTPKRKRR